MSPINLIKLRLKPLKHKDFRNFFITQFVSTSGNWMQELAKSWIVINMVGTASAMGALLLASAVPTLIFSSFGGVLADKKSIRSILIVTQVLLATLALSLGLFVMHAKVELWHLLVFAMMEGIIIGFDLPAFSKVVPSLVPREDLQQAMAMNSVQFHLSRVVGPTIAGLIMGFSGPVGVFFANAISFIGVVFIIAKIKFPAHVKANPDDKVTMKDAFKYMRSNSLLWRLYIQMILITGLLFPLAFTTFRVYLKQKFALDSQAFGLTFAVPGFGALMGSLTFLLWSPKNPLKALPFGIIGLAVFLLLLSVVNLFSLAMLSLVVFSYSMYLSLAALNVTLQLNLDHQMRGRVGALVGVLFSSLAPVMSAPMAYVSDMIGAQLTMQIVAGIFILTSFILVRRKDF